MLVAQKKRPMERRAAMEKHTVSNVHLFMSSWVLAASVVIPSAASVCMLPRWLVYSLVSFVFSTSVATLWIAATVGHACVKLDGVMSSMAEYKRLFITGVLWHSVAPILVLAHWNDMWGSICPDEGEGGGGGVHLPPGEAYRRFWNTIVCGLGVGAMYVVCVPDVHAVYPYVCVKTLVAVAFGAYVFAAAVLSFTFIGVASIPWGYIVETCVYLAQVAYIVFSHLSALLVFVCLSVYNKADLNRVVKGIS